MPNLPTLIATHGRSLLVAASGSDIAINAIAQGFGAVPPVYMASVQIGHAPAELMEISLPLKYPTVNIFCEKLENSLKEKFRTFSGTGRLILEIRHSQDQIQNVQQALENYVSAVCQILDGNRGDWGSGLFYAGGYDVQFGSVKRGGKSFVQTARVALTVDISL